MAPKPWLIARTYPITSNVRGMIGIAPSSNKTPLHSHHNPSELSMLIIDRNSAKTMLAEIATGSIIHARMKSDNAYGEGNDGIGEL